VTVWGEPVKVSRVIGDMTATLMVIIGGTLLVSQLPAAADAYTQKYTVTTGPYYPSWDADICLTAYQSSGSPHYQYGSIYASVSPGRCAGTAADMGSGWLGVQVAGYENGTFCGNTGISYNSSAGSGFWIGPYDLCSGGPGTNEYDTTANGNVYSYFNGEYQYVGTGPAVVSPYQN
jgi:hypothetical protein